MPSLLLSNPFLAPFFHWFARFCLGAVGWQTKGEIPDLKKYVLIAAPHSTNWDFVYFLLIIFKFRIPVRWMGKESMFIPPFKGLLKRLGGIPVNRTVQGNLVADMAQEFDRTDRMILTIAPSGTRQKVKRWKTGFYQIALQAKIPIVCGFIDYEKKQGGMGPVFFPTGNMESDLKAIQDFYKDKSGKYPEYGTAGSAL
ncbi:lysophospholipid acyltransferase family protein [Desulfospira joergensenii]|uniref:lysophospholipid acyltransferase family protein n=1 Tax=Desulfospira joergensenii TaxID=53329 RepID=UPI0003B5E7A8|nr:lysophospholipid acyltransferase family protein [Desulfospira joergensenii]